MEDKLIAAHRKVIEAVNAVRDAKSENRTEQDRYLAIVVTELEKAEAVLLTFVINSKKSA